MRAAVCTIYRSSYYAMHRNRDRMCTVEGNRQQSACTPCQSTKLAPASRLIVLGGNKPGKASGLEHVRRLLVCAHIL